MRAFSSGPEKNSIKPVSLTLSCPSHSGHFSRSLFSVIISVPRSRQHQRDIVRLFLIANPVVDRAGNQLGDFDKWPPTVLADQFDESLFAELPEVVFRLGNPVAVGYEDLARPELFRSFVERKI